MVCKTPISEASSVRAVSIPETQSSATSFSLSESGRSISPECMATSSVPEPTFSQQPSTASCAKATVSAAAFHQKEQACSASSSMAA